MVSLPFILHLCKIQVFVYRFKGVILRLPDTRFDGIKKLYIFILLSNPGHHRDIGQ